MDAPPERGAGADPPPAGAGARALRVVDAALLEGLGAVPPGTAAGPGGGGGQGAAAAEEEEGGQGGRGRGEAVVMSNAGLRSWLEASVRFEGALRATLAEVNLSYNCLVSLDGIEKLQGLRKLDVRYNDLPSLAHLTAPLAQCPALEHVAIFRCGVWAQRPKAYVPEAFKWLPALHTVDGEANPRPLSAKQWRAQRFLQRAYGVKPNGVAAINLDGFGVSAEDFGMVLRALSFLPVKRLHLLHNPCSAVRAYRFCVIQQLPGLEALDGAPVTQDEVVNATKTLEAIAEDTRVAVRDLAWQTHQMAGGGTDRRVGHSSRRHSDPVLLRARESREVIIELAEPLGSGHGGARGDPARVLREVASSPGASALIQTASYMQVTLAAGGASGATSARTSRSSIMEVASKQLQDDVKEFLAEDPVGETLKINGAHPELLKTVELAPVEALTGTLAAKAEIVLNFLQIYWLIYTWNVRWPLLWEAVNSSLSVTHIVLNTLPSLVVGQGGPSDSMFFGLIVFIALCWLLFALKSVPTFGWFDRLCWRFAGQSSDMFRRRAALAGITATYMPAARYTILSFIPPGPNLAAEVPLARQVVAGFALVGGVVATPVAFYFLIKRGTQEAAGARALQRIASEIKAIRQQLLDACEKHDIATVTRKTLQVHDRRHAYELKYATAVREYQKPQGYLYQDFRQHAKYFKCAVMSEKFVILVITIAFTYVANPRDDRLPVVQAFLGAAVLLAGTVFTGTKRPFQASAENLMECVLRTTNTLTAVTAFLISIAERFHEEGAMDGISGSITAGLLVCLNASALAFCLGETLATPWMRRVAKAQTDRLRQLEINALLRESRAQTPPPPAAAAASGGAQP